MFGTPTDAIHHGKEVRSHGPHALLHLHEEATGKRNTPSTSAGVHAMHALHAMHMRLPPRDCFAAPAHPRPQAATAKI